MKEVICMSKITPFASKDFKEIQKRLHSEMKENPNLVYFRHTKKGDTFILYLFEKKNK